jgi:hypothetical protein
MTKQTFADGSLRLLAIGREIEAKLKKADVYGVKAEDMVRSVNQLLAEAEKICKHHRISFKDFKQARCPSLGKSRAYELLAIAAGKKTIEQTRKATRQRVAKHRAKPKHSVTVTEKLIDEDAELAKLMPVFGVVADNEPKPTVETQAEIEARLKRDGKLPLLRGALQAEAMAKVAAKADAAVPGAPGGTNVTRRVANRLYSFYMKFVPECDALIEKMDQEDKDHMIELLNLATARLIQLRQRIEGVEFSGDAA